DVVAVQQVGVFAHLVEHVIHGVGDGALAATAQAGEPQNRAALALQLFAILAGNPVIMPGDIGCLLLSHRSELTVDWEWGARGCDPRECPYQRKAQPANSGGLWGRPCESGTSGSGIHDVLWNPPGQDVENLSCHAAPQFHQRLL